jgi:hypothetical protein
MALLSVVPQMSFPPAAPAAALPPIIAQPSIASLKSAAVLPSADEEDVDLNEAEEEVQENHKEDNNMVLMSWRI